MIQPSLTQVLASALYDLTQSWKRLLAPATLVAMPLAGVVLLIFSTTEAGTLADLAARNPDGLQTLSPSARSQLTDAFGEGALVSTGYLILAGLLMASIAHRLAGRHIVARSEDSPVQQLSQRFPSIATAGLLALSGPIFALVLGGVLWSIPMNAVGTPSLSTTFVAGLLLAALVVPGLAILAAFSLATSSATLEGRGPVEAMRRSVRLTRGLRTQTIGYLAVVGLLACLAILMIQTIAFPILATAEAIWLTLLGGWAAATTQMWLAGVVALMVTHWFLALTGRQADSPVLRRSRA